MPVKSCLLLQMLQSRAQKHSSSIVGKHALKAAWWVHKLDEATGGQRVLIPFFSSYQLQNKRCLLNHFSYLSGKENTTSMTVQFNVGGKHFEISRAVVSKYPNSKLERLMLDESLKQPIFIDRNGDVFAVCSCNFASCLLLVMIELIIWHHSHSTTSLQFLAARPWLHAI